MAKIKYTASLDGRIVGNRSSDRTYTHAVVINGHDKTDAVATWCGRLDLAQGEQRKYARYGYRAEIVPVEIAAPKAKPAARIEAIAKPAPAARTGIENIYVHTGGHGGQPTIHWTIGDRRFHVWLRDRDAPEDTVHSNPIVAKNDRRNEHRSLDRTSKTQAAIWAQVWDVVQRDDLIAKCRAADLAKRNLERRQAELEHTITEIEHQALLMFRDGAFSLDPAAFERLYVQRRNARATLEALQ